jgi:hypothetical protein
MLQLKWWLSMLRLPIESFGLLLRVRLCADFGDTFFVSRRFLVNCRDPRCTNFAVALRMVCKKLGDIHLQILIKPGKLLLRHLIVLERAGGHPENLFYGSTIGETTGVRIFGDRTDDAICRFNSYQSNKIVAGDSQNPAADFHVFDATQCVIKTGCFFDFAS